MHSSNYLALIILPTLSGLLLVTACTKTVYNSKNRAQRILICCKGYKFSPNTANSYLCEPICISSCDNGFCRAPNVCGCHEGYENMRHDPTKSCVPVCSSGCKNGRCVAPNKCDCDAGYQPIEDGSCRQLSANPGFSHNISSSVCPTGCAPNRISLEN
ncbi:protein draper-like [Drosophila hydei]|uniref:Protein draper-like n=1 Tax=Drosophila hydei TaxID=7224 RepID=A0A6J2SRN3_DROHY|nr:protein draper-like [Drosophila hydei]